MEPDRAEGGLPVTGSMHAHVLQHRMLHAALEPVRAEGALMTDIVAVDVVLSGIFICACKKNEIAGSALVLLHASSGPVLACAPD